MFNVHTIHTITVLIHVTCECSSRIRFLRFFLNSKKIVTFYIFWLCFTRFLELCLCIVSLSQSAHDYVHTCSISLMSSNEYDAWMTRRRWMQSRTTVIRRTYASSYHLIISDAATAPAVTEATWNNGNGCVQSGSVSP